MHMIDMTTGRAAIAYRNDKPWHGLGQEMPRGASLEQWAHDGGINYDVKPAIVQFAPTDHDRIHMPSRYVLYRSDTFAPLGIVGAGYKIVQPRQILEMFRDLVDLAGFELETVGALSDGKRIWVLAKVNDGAIIAGKDTVRRYLLAATSYDGTMSTVLKFVDERVVCHNTITAALGEKGKSFRVHHGLEFDVKAAKEFMGLGVTSFHQFVGQMRALALMNVTTEQVEGTTLQLLRPDAPPADQEAEEEKIRDSKAFKRIVALFEKEQIGDKELGMHKNAWRWINAVTQYVDWEQGITASSRMNSAWFGQGDALKSKALKMLTTGSVTA